MDHVIETRDLTVYYNRHRGIVDVNLTVEKGEVFGFLGPNGAGKTTTQRVLLDVIRLTKAHSRRTAALLRPSPSLSYSLAIWATI